ncbi:unnamed protein product [Gordionus sp. m RMFG-2023]|uniref:molybdopterin synthase catalytic subunit-like isoform X2 n=1 Tax=Gordionus sp. m RMFG-2023 TaxID=3053472 RepID=UPI0030E24C49
MKNLIALSNEPLDVNNILKFLTEPENGAISLFIGTTREDKITYQNIKYNNTNNDNLSVFHPESEGKNFDIDLIKPDTIFSTHYLLYEAFEPMALKVMNAICSEIDYNNFNHSINKHNIIDTNLSKIDSSISEFTDQLTINNISNEIGNIAILHRLGKVNVGETSVCIGVSSPHRKFAIKAVEYAIESLKQRVPIWKKEIYKAKFSHNTIIEYGCWKDNG